MKKLLGILTLTILLIFAAGCVSPTDEIIGTWQADVYEEGYTIIQTLFEDGSGTICYSYHNPDGYEEIYPAFWTKLDDGLYMVLEYNYYTISEDGKTITDNWGYDFILEEGADKIGGVWTMVNEESEDYYYTIVFYENGTGIETYYEEGSEPISNDIGWEERDGRISWTYRITHLYTEDGRLDLGDDVYLTKIDEMWVESPAIGTYKTTTEIINGYWIERDYSVETGELEGTYGFYVVENGEKKLVLYDCPESYTQTMQEDGTLLCECGDVFTKITA